MKQQLAQLPGSAGSGRPRRAKGYVFGLALLIGLLAVVGCSQGSYPLDVFYEMHYQQSYKAHEPPRLSAPASAVPVYAPQQATSFTLDGEHLYQVNCSMCHGATGKGDGSVLQKMINTYGSAAILQRDRQGGGRASRGMVNGRRPLPTDDERPNEDLALMT